MTQRRRHLWIKSDGRSEWLIEDEKLEVVQTDVQVGNDVLAQEISIILAKLGASNETVLIKQCISSSDAQLL